MSTKLLAIGIAGSNGSPMAFPRYLRIAVPSWRSVGINTRAEPGEDLPVLSREEIQSLFHGELTGRVRRRSGLTLREEQEKSLAKRIRAALYPRAAAFATH